MTWQPYHYRLPRKTRDIDVSSHAVIFPRLTCFTILGLESSVYTANTSLSLASCQDSLAETVKARSTAWEKARHGFSKFLPAS